MTSGKFDAVQKAKIILLGLFSVRLVQQSQNLAGHKRVYLFTATGVV